MLLKKLKLNNFRQFYDFVSIDFDIVDGRNITIIHAENGVGKTALLNAVNWAFFEKLTSNFRNPKNLINDTAQKEGKVSCSVEIEFEEDGVNFWLLRRFDKKTRKSVVKIHKMDGSTWGSELPEAELVINSILPKEMSEYFFFQGEGSNAVDSGNNQGNLAKSIRNILGFKVAENLLDSLASRQLSIRKKKAALDTSGESTKLELAIQKDERELEAKLKDMLSAEDRKPQLEHQIEETEEQLSKIQNKDLFRLKKEESEASRRLTTLKDKKNKLLRDKYSKIAKYGWAVFGSEFAKTSLDFIDESELKGRIPEPYNQQLIIDLLEATKCICGRSLEEGSDEYKNITSLLAKAANPKLLQRLRGINAQINAIQMTAKDAYQDISDSVSNYDDTDEQIQQLEHKLTNLHQQIISIPEKEISRLQTILRTLKTDRDNQVRKITALDIQITSLKRNIESNEKKKEQFTSNNDVITGLKERSNFIRLLQDFISEYLVKMEQGVRLHVLEEVNNTLERFSRHDFKIRVSNNFEFLLLDKYDNKVGQGDGLNLLLNLTITTALINFAGKYKDVKDPILNTTTVAPLFIDAPFGVLDNKYRSVVVRELPKSVNQIIFLVSSSQWTEEMDAEIRDSINSEYCVILEESAEQKNKEVDKISIQGKEYILSRYGCDTDRTVIEKVH